MIVVPILIYANLLLELPFRSKSCVGSSSKIWLLWCRDSLNDVIVQLLLAIDALNFVS